MIHIITIDGFVGKNLLEYSLENNVFSVNGISFKDCDLLNFYSVEKSLKNLDTNDIIIMTSGITRLSENSVFSYEKNIQMAVNLSKHLLKNPIKQLIFLSTIDVYGDTSNKTITEELAPNPIDYYASSKLSSEMILRNACNEKKINFLALRMPGIYGKYDDGKGAINKLVSSAYDGKIIINGTGEDLRDLVHVRDLCKLIYLGIEKNIHGLFNVATGKSTSVNEIVQIITKNLNNNAEIEHINFQNYLPKNIIFDNAKIKNAFSNFEFMDIKEGLNLYINDYRKQHGGN